MNWQIICFAAAGVVGSGVAIVHGVLTQRLMVKPFSDFAGDRTSATIQRLVPMLLHFSTVIWFLGGLALIAAGWLAPPFRIATAVFVGALFLYGALGNLWGTRGRHPGWMLMALALGLIGAGLMA